MPDKAKPPPCIPYTTTGPPTFNIIIVVVVVVVVVDSIRVLAFSFPCYLLKKTKLVVVVVVVVLARLPSSRCSDIRPIRPTFIPFHSNNNNENEKATRGNKVDLITTGYTDRKTIQVSKLVSSSDAKKRL